MAHDSDQNLARSFIDGLPKPQNLGTSAPPKPLMTEGPLTGPTLQNVAPSGAPTIQSPVSPQAQVSPPKPSTNPAWTPALQAEIDATKAAQSAQAAEANITRRFTQFNSGSAAWTPALQAEIDATKAAQSAQAAEANITRRFTQFNSGRRFTQFNLGSRLPQGAGKILQFAGKAAPYATAALTVADVASRLQSARPQEIQRSDMLANFDSRGLGPSDAFMFAPHTPSSEADPRLPIREATQKAAAFRAAERAGVPTEPDPYGLQPAKMLRPTPTPITDSAVREPPSNLEVVPPAPQAVTPMLTSVGAGYGVDSGPARQGGFTAKHYYGPNGNIVASGVSSASSRGGFVGAATDAEAARNLQDRLAQDQAAQVMAANINRGAEAERNARAERLGISRSVLDQMEGRPTPPSLFDAPQQTTQDTTPFSRPGDGFGDAELRQARMQRDIEGAKGRKKNALVAQYAAEFTKPAHAGGSGQNSSDDRLKLYLNQLDRMDKSRDRAVDNARADQSLELQRAQLQESQTQGQYNRDRGAAEFLRNQSNDRLKLGEDRLNLSTQAAQRFVDDFKGQVDLAAVKNYGRQLIADPRLAQVDPGLAQRIRDNVLTYEDLHALKKMADAGRDPTHWYNPVSWFSDAPTPSQTVDKVYLNR